MFANDKVSNQFVICSKGIPSDLRLYQQLQIIAYFTIGLMGVELPEYLLDNPQVEQLFQQLLVRIRAFKNGDVVAAMRRGGIDYRTNFGVSIPQLREIASVVEPNHLLALKLWNKQWRETMILATLLEQPERISDNQVDFWVKNIPTEELAEQIAMNLLSCLSNPFQKAHDYCLGKKRLVKIAGLLTIGRLALVSQTAPNEQFDQVFELMSPLSRDPQLSTIFNRVFIQIGMRNVELYQTTLNHARMLLTIDSAVANRNGELILEELDHADILAIVRQREDRLSHT